MPFLALRLGVARHRGRIGGGGIPAGVEELLREQGRDDILITGGGILPKEDMDELQKRGVGKLFGPGTATTELVEYIKEWFTARERQGA